MDKEVISIMGQVQIIQTRQIIEDMREDCSSEIEKMILNDKMLSYLVEKQKFMKYEKAKEEFVTKNGDMLAKNGKDQA